MVRCLSFYDKTFAEKLVAAECDIKPKRGGGPVEKMSADKVNVEVEDDSESEAGRLSILLLFHTPLTKAIEAKPTLKRKAPTKKPVAKGKAKAIDLE